jgi:hypothetical protein
MIPNLVVKVSLSPIIMDLISWGIVHSRFKAISPLNKAQGAFRSILFTRGMPNNQIPYQLRGRWIISTPDYSPPVSTSTAWVGCFFNTQLALLVLRIMAAFWIPINFSRQACFSSFKSNQRIFHPGKVATIN